MNDEKLIPNWLAWARDIQAIAQSGLHFSANEFETERYLKLQQIAANMVAFAAEYDPEEVLGVFKLGEGYATPKVDVRGAVINAREELLLVREKRDGGWTLPGGWADVGDVPSEGAEREVWEEAGFRVKARKVIGVYDANRVGPLELFHAFKVVFLCDLISGEARPSMETSEVAFFGPDEIPQVLSGERIRPRQIQDAFAAYKDPDWLTVFD